MTVRRRMTRNGPRAAHVAGESAQSKSTRLLRPHPVAGNERSRPTPCRQARCRSSHTTSCRRVGC